MIGKKLYYVATNIPEYIDSMVSVIEQVDTMSNGTPVYLCENKDGVRKKVLGCNLSESFINIKTVFYNQEYNYLPASVARFKVGD